MSRPVRIFWKVVLYGFIAFILFLLGVNVGLFGKMPSLAQLENPTITQATEVYGDDGTPMGKYYRDKGNRSNVQYKDISKHVVNALVATEDERFYNHSGIDGVGMLRAIAFVGNKGGGSGITQQLALNLFDERASNPVTPIIQKLKKSMTFEGLTRC